MQYLAKKYTKLKVKILQINLYLVYNSKYTVEQKYTLIQKVRIINDILKVTSFVLALAIEMSNFVLQFIHKFNR
jgi:hypothetical protein